MNKTSKGTQPAAGRTKRKLTHLSEFTSGTVLGGTVSSYRNNQNIYKQGTPASTLFYIQKGGVRLSTRSGKQASVVTAILGTGDFFGEFCLSGYPLRLSSAITLTASSIRLIEKEEMLQTLRKKTQTSNSLVAYLLSSVKSYNDQVAHLMTASAEQRLAAVLLRLAQLDRHSPAAAEIPRMSHRLLAEMVGTTRSRINFFMNRFRRKGFIHYDGGLEIHQTLRKALKEF